MHKILLLSLRPPKHLPQSLRLLVILLSNNLPVKRRGLANPVLVMRRGSLGVGKRSERGAVVWLRAVVPVNDHSAIALEGVMRAERAVCGDLLVVDAQAVTVGIRVREEAGLEDGVG